jgi:magnesium transporter
MKRQYTYTFAPVDFTWIDLVNPSDKDLKALAKQFNLDKSSVIDCLDPKHLPKFEKLNNYYFVILRHSDEEATQKADTVQELTRKVAIFVGANFLLTVHRKDAKFFQDIRKRWQEPSKDEVTGESIAWPPDTAVQIIHEVVSSALVSYQAPLEMAGDQLEELEMGIFDAAGGTPFEMEKVYYLKRKASVYKRIIQATQDVLLRYQTNLPQLRLQDLKEDIDKLHFYAEELNDNVAGLMNLYLQMSAHKTNEASYRTNEVIRILTVASLFFLPLNFITGLYGMNFEFIPELKSRNGFHGVILAMSIIVVTLYVWFKKKGLLQPAPKVEKPIPLGDLPASEPASASEKSKA